MRHTANVVPFPQARVRLLSFEQRKLAKERELGLAPLAPVQQIPLAADSERLAFELVSIVEEMYAYIRQNYSPSDAETLIAFIKSEDSL